MGVFEQLGSLALATRLKILSDSLAKDVGNIYRQLNIQFEPRWFTLFWTLKTRHTLTITELAQELRQTHAAAVQLTNLLEKKGLVMSSKDKNDERRRQVSLTPKGLKLFDEVEPVLQAIEQANSDLILLTAPDFLGNLEALEQALDQKSMHDRILENMGMLNQGIVLKAYSADYKNAFYDLNEAWMEEYLGAIEQHDRLVMEEPEKKIIAAGGMVFFAILEHEAVGMGALYPIGTSSAFRLNLFTVTKKLRKRGIGNSLFEQIKSFATSKRASALVVYVTPALVDAINFFIKRGFYMAPMKEEDLAEVPANCLKLVLTLQS